jgi:hypothetical protein
VTRLAQPECAELDALQRRVHLGQQIRELQG